MTRKEILSYIERTHGDALSQVGLLPVDTPEALGYVIDDALRMSNDEKRKAEADRRVAILIHDRADMLGIEATPAPDAVEEEE